MTTALAATDQLGILPHLVEHHSTAKQPASYVIDGALDTEIRVTFTSVHGTVVGAGKTLDEAAMDVRNKMAATPELKSEPESEPEVVQIQKPKAKPAPVITRSNRGA